MYNLPNFFVIKALLMGKYTWLFIGLNTKQHWMLLISPPE